MDDFFPYRIKLFECCLIKMLTWLQTYDHPIDKNQHKLYHNFFDPEKFIDESFTLFCDVNHIEKSKREEVKGRYFIPSEADNKFPKDIKVHSLKIPNSKSSGTEKARICLVNKYVNIAESLSSLDGQPVTDVSRYEEFNKILDDIKRVANPDIVIMPEVCLPYRFIPYFVNYSVHNQVALITGVEHWKIGSLAFNFVLTVLPTAYQDAIVIPRLKNHYAPEEEKTIREKLLVVPKPKPYIYDLIQWRDIFFSTFYCFELADVKHRNLFFGLVDVLFVPIWNADMHYYNSLVESSSRDLHCFIAMCNTTQYGDSRITRPSDHIHRDKLRVKGGTVKDHKATVLVSDLEIKKLRYFQTHLIVNPEEFNKEHKTYFKPLPPDYPHKFAVGRYNLSLFSKL